MAATGVPDKSHATEHEAGRLLFARPWRFIAGAPSLAVLPLNQGIEVAFAGRSNVGKSSLINALTGRKGLARTSDTPGRTRELNLYGNDAGAFIVDMPGYGYAKVSKREVMAWTAMLFDYLRGRHSLRRAYLLIDARHGLKPNDLDALPVLDKAAVSYQIVLTKADKVQPAELSETIVAVREQLARRAAAHPEVIATSSQTGMGIAALRAEIAGLT
ncbi:ribosome biogenesis GTP-binding protein YihA/YsxC [soil metagenome]